MVPTTLGVGVSLVTSAKGNVALAIFLTVGTNVLGVVFIPLWLKLLLTQGVSGVEGVSAHTRCVCAYLCVDDTCAVEEQEEEEEEVLHQRMVVMVAVNHAA